METVSIDPSNKDAKIVIDFLFFLKRIQKKTKKRKKEEEVLAVPFLAQYAMVSSSCEPMLMWHWLTVGLTLPQFTAASCAEL